MDAKNFMWQRLDFTVRHEVRKTGDVRGGLCSVSNRTPAVFSVFQAEECHCWGVREHELILYVLCSFELLCKEYFQYFLNTFLFLSARASALPRGPGWHWEPQPTQTGSAGGFAYALQVSGTSCNSVLLPDGNSNCEYPRSWGTNTSGSCSSDCWFYRIFTCIVEKLKPWIQVLAQWCLDNVQKIQSLFWLQPLAHWTRAVCQWWGGFLVVFCCGCLFFFLLNPA